MLTSSEDEFDIVGEGEIDNVEEERHLGTRFPPIHVEPIADCSRLSISEWVNLEVVFLSEC